MTQRTETTRPSLVRSPHRLILAGLGLLCVGLALVGVVLPGMPTTVFLILASYLFARSCPVLEDKLLRIRAFRPYLRYVRGDAAIPLRARILALLAMWTAVCVSLATLAAGRGLQAWMAGLILGAAAVGTVAILGWRRGTTATVSHD